MGERVKCVVLWFPMGWVSEWSGLVCWVEVKIVKKFYAAVEIV